MSEIKEEITKMADGDSPEHVKVDGTIQSLIVWAIARFGVGIIGFAFGWKVYTDMRDDYKVARDEKARMVDVFDRLIEQQKELRISFDRQQASFDRQERSFGDLVKTLEKK